jgi:polyhydroxybutyrate depolymerase
MKDLDRIKKLFQSNESETFARSLKHSAEKSAHESVLCFLLSIFLLLPFHSHATDVEKKIYIDELEREYLIHLPSDYSSTSQCPVIFAFHGGGGNYENTVSMYNLNAAAEQHHFIIVYPNAINKSWSMEGVGSMIKEEQQQVDDVKFISTLMDTLTTHYHVDSTAFFCTGISRGGIFSLFLISKLSGRFKAIAPVCASIPQSIADQYTFYPTSILLINGTDDPLIPFEGGYSEIGRSKKNADNYFISTPELVKKIKKLNTCPEISITHHITNTQHNDQCTAQKITYHCSGTQVVFIKVMHGGHTWPGGQQYLSKNLVGNVCQDFKAEEEIVNFFVSLR